jgi:uncharacterized protein YecE (DUF72 family)
VRLRGLVQADQLIARLLENLPRLGPALTQLPPWITENYLVAFEEELKKAKDPDSFIRAMTERFSSADFLLALERGAKANVQP